MSAARGPTNATMSSELECASVTSQRLRHSDVGIFVVVEVSKTGRVRVEEGASQG